jgi:hypothetical protein
MMADICVLTEQCIKISKFVYRGHPLNHLLLVFYWIENLVLQQNAIKFCQIDEALIAQTKDEEGQFKVDIAKVYQAIEVNHFRTLGEYLFNLEVNCWSNPLVRSS